MRLRVKAFEAYCLSTMSKAPSVPNNWIGMLEAAQAVGAPVQFINAGVYIPGGTYHAGDATQNNTQNNSGSGSNTGGNGNGTKQEQRETMRSVLEEVLGDHEQRNQHRHDDLVREVRGVPQTILRQRQMDPVTNRCIIHQFEHSFIRKLGKKCFGIFSVLINLYANPFCNFYFDYK